MNTYFSRVLFVLSAAVLFTEINNIKNSTGYSSELFTELNNIKNSTGYSSELLRLF